MIKIPKSVNKTITSQNRMLFGSFNVSKTQKDKVQI